MASAVCGGFAIRLQRLIVKLYITIKIKNNATFSESSNTAKDRNIILDCNEIYNDPKYTQRRLFQIIH